MKNPSRIFVGLLLTCAVVGCDSMELTIGVEPGAPGALEVFNAGNTDWTDARLVIDAVESDNSSRRCTEKTIGAWAPGDSVSVPMCGNKIRLTLTTGGESSRFSYANGQLYRVFGRKEVPVAP